MTAILVDKISVVFGGKVQACLAAGDLGQTRDMIAQQHGATLAIHDCSLEIRQAETLVLMGLSGSGKSTLLRSLNRLNPLARGKIWLENRGEKIEISTASPAQLRLIRTEIISMVFQQFALLPWRTVADNIGFGLEIAGTGKYARRQIIAEQLELVGLTGWANRLVGELSGGMQQRVGIARAFATGAPILLMDEPFSALDPLIRTRLQDELLQLQQKFHKTLVFVSHDLDEALKMGDRIAIMEDGRILQCGTAQEIVLKPANIHVAQFVRHINPLRFLTAKDVMITVKEDEPLGSCSGEVGATLLLADILTALDNKKERLAVTENGKLIGTIRAEDIIHHLVAYHTG